MRSGKFQLHVGPHGVDLTTASGTYRRGFVYKDDPYHGWARSTDKYVDAEFYSELSNVLVGLVKMQSVIRKDALFKALDRVDIFMAINHEMDMEVKYVGQKHRHKFNLRWNLLKSISFFVESKELKV